MLRSLLQVVTFLLVLLMATPAMAFVDPPTFEPAAPNSAQPITVLVRNGLCHGFLAPGPGIPPMRIERSPGVVDVIAPGLITFEPFCNGPPFTDQFDIGPLPAGDYQVRIWIMDFTYQFEETTQVASASLTVTQGPAHSPIPTTGTYGLIALGAAIFLFALPAMASRRRSMFALIALIGSTSASAQSQEQMLMVLLSASPNAPTPQMLVEPVVFSSGYLGELSSGFTAENPERAYYLLVQRASGDFQAWIQANPEDERAKLERYVLVTYPETANLQTALTALANDPNVLYAFEPEEISFSSTWSDTRPLLPHVGAKSSAGAPGQDWVSDMGLDRAWTLAGGWSLVGTLDNGLNTTHPDLVPFDGSGTYVGGNYLSAYSGDVGRSTGNLPPLFQIELNVDERQAVPATNVVCDPDEDGFMVPTFAGHGTHVAGLIGANSANADGTVGACKHCGISAWRVASEACLNSGVVRVAPTLPAIAAALTYISDFGIQVVNQSFGLFTTGVDRCATANQNDAWCLAITKANARGLLQVGASGNDRRAINFPSEDSRVVAVGGLEPDLSFWNDRLDMPANLLVGDCPDPVIAELPALGRECGSNFTPATAGERRQEVTLPARDVYSTVYPGVNWGTVLECGDSYDANASDGQGFCTGTSMSAPLYSGLAGLLRSINPLVMPGDPENVVDAIGIRDVVVESASIPGGGTWNAQFGYGIPDAEIAARRMLGTVGGSTVRNRLTPLFALYSAASTDLAYVTVPQAALALTISSASSYLSQGSLVSGYPAFPESATAVPQPPTSDLSPVTSTRAESLMLHGSAQALTNHALGGAQAS